MFSVDSSRLLGTRLPNPVCNRPPTACERSQVPNPPNDEGVGGWGRGGGCPRDVQIGVKMLLKLQTPLFWKAHGRGNGPRLPRAVAWRYTRTSGVKAMHAGTLLADSCVFYSRNRTRIQNGSRGMMVP